MNKKRIMWIGIGVIAVLALIFVFSRNASQQANAQLDESGDEVVEAFIGDLSAGATASGTLLPQRETSLSVASPGQVTAVNVRIGDTVTAGSALIQLDTAALEIAVTQAELSLKLAEVRLADLQSAPKSADVASAEASVASAQARLDDLLDGPSAEEIAIAEASVRVSEANLAASVADLGSANSSITDAQIQAAQAALLNAELQLESAVEANEDDPTEQTHQARLNAEQAYASAKAQLDLLLAGPDTAAAQSSIAGSNARLEGSQITFENTVGGASEIDIANAEAALAQAEASLANLVDPPSAESISAAQAEVEQARLNLEAAQESLAEATIVAPFDGLVTAVNVNVGELATGTVVELVDSQSMEVVLEVDEVDVDDFTVGQSATVTLEAWPDTEIESEISFISPQAQQNNNALVTYEVYLTLGETDLPALVGMTANANLITAQREDVLLIPNAAITPNRQAGTYSVLLQLDDGTTQEVDVTIGLRDGEYTEITSGLAAGDKVIIEAVGSGLDFGGGPFGG